MATVVLLLKLLTISVHYELYQMFITKGVGTITGLDYWTGLLDSPKLQNTNFEISRGQRTRAYLISVQQ